MKIQVKELVEFSYKDGQLDEKTVKTITDRLNRSMLKQYINLLKREEKKSVVFVTTPKPLTTQDKEKIKAQFPKKKIIEQIDPAMISGITIVKNDESYEMNLNRTFHDIIRFVSNND